MKVTVLLIVIGALGMISKESVKAKEDLEIRGSIIKIGENTEKRPGEVPVRKHQLTLIGKTLKGVQEIRI